MCPWSGVLLTPESYDHLLRISVYSLNESWNVVPAERHFNQHVKRDRLPSPKRRQRAYPHRVVAYGHYLVSPALILLSTVAQAHSLLASEESDGSTHLQQTGTRPHPRDHRSRRWAL